VALANVRVAFPLGLHHLTLHLIQSTGNIRIPATALTQLPRRQRVASRLKWQGDLVSTEQPSLELQLHAAARAGDVAALKNLLRYGDVDVDAKNYEAETALSQAARDGHRDVVELLLKAGADPNRKSDAGRTPLAWAAQNGDEEMVKLLLRWGADPNVLSDTGRTPLSWAAQNGHEGVVRALLRGTSS
jgi:ankyrin repeat protein